MVRLIVKKYDGKEEILSSLESETLIGRDDPSSGIINHINLSDNTVSRRHAKIYLEQHSFYIEDMDSSNGTWVNDHKIKKVKLLPGDKVNIGRNILIFESEGTRTINPLDFIVDEEKLDHNKTIDSNYFILQKLSKLLTVTTNLEDFLQSVVQMIIESIKASRGVLLLLDEEGKQKNIVTSGEKAVFSEEAVKQVLSQKKSLLVGYDFEASTTMINRGIHSAICAPIIKEPRVYGVIYLEDPLPGRFGEEELVILTLFANQLAAGIENVFLSESIQKEFMIRSNLERFLSPQVVELVTMDCLDRGEIFLKTNRVDATIIFSDIKGFTRLSEKLDPQEIADILSQHFSLMTEVIFANEGTLDKYVGDGLVAIFGAPFPCEDHAHKAVKAGLQMLKQQEKFSENLPPEKKFAIRIGINTGSIIAGYMGSPKRMEYTVLGEPVIIAQRLQSLADPNTIYLGKETYQRVKDIYAGEFVTKMKTPKGLKEMEIYRLIGAT